MTNQNDVVEYDDDDDESNYDYDDNADNDVTFNFPQHPLASPHKPNM